MHAYSLHAHAQPIFLPFLFCLSGGDGYSTTTQCVQTDCFMKARTVLNVKILWADQSVHA